MAKTVPEIPKKLFYKIGEVCEITDTQPYVLRFWESEFPQLSPKKNRSGQRVYQRRDIETVVRIKKLLYEEEYTIAGARKKLEEESASGKSSTGDGRSGRSGGTRAARRRPRSVEGDHPVDELAARPAPAARTTAVAAAPGKAERLDKALAEIKKSLKEVLQILRGE